MRPQIESSELCALWLPGLKSFDQLDGPAQLRFGSHIGRYLRAADSLYLAYLDGVLDTRVWRGYERSLADVLATPGFRDGGQLKSTDIRMGSGHYWMTTSARANL